jgi:sulfoxide reductase heme-binding subunit YedZ
LKPPPIRYVKPLVFAAALIPAAALAYDAYIGELTANPVDYITDETGTWALGLLTISLAITPIRRLTGWNEIIKLRRMLGLFAFFYASLHVLTWIVLVSFFDLPTMIEDVAERPFITVGMATFLILLALALTSTTASIRRLGRKWQQLHRLVYVAAIGAVVHFWWLVKADVTEPRRWALAVAAVLGFRVWWHLRSRATAVRRLSQT